MLQIVIHCVESDGVTIGTRIAQDSAIIANKDKVNAPCINTYRCYLYVAVCHFAQAANYLEVKSVDVPIVVTTLLYQVVWKACNLFQFNMSVVDRADDGSATCSSKIYGKKTFLCFHIVCFSNSKSVSDCKSTKTNNTKILLFDFSSRFFDLDVLSHHFTRIFLALPSCSFSPAGHATYTPLEAFPVTRRP